MSGNVLDFYEELADYYHLIFDDWRAQSSARQGFSAIYWPHKE